MHVMIATDGSLDPERTTSIASSLAGDDGRITVVSVVEVPREMLDDMRNAAGGASAASPTAEYQRSQAGDAEPTHWVGDDAIVSQYVNRKLAERTAGLTAALDAADVDYAVVGLEGENAARTVLATVEDHDVDALLIGTHGLGRFEGLLGSTSTKLARRTPCSVVLVR